MTTLAEALATIEAADPAELMKAEMHRAVADVDFTREAARKPPGPSMAGLDPRNQYIVEAQQRSHDAMIERDRLRASQRAASREELVRDLAAGQAPSSIASIKASIANGG